MSTVRGKKSVPSRTERLAVAVASNIVSPRRASTAPSASCARCPASKVSVLSVRVTGLLTRIASVMVSPTAVVDPPPGSQWATFAHGEDSPLASEESAVSCVEFFDAIRLATYAETPDQSSVTLHVAALHVIEQPATLADENHETAAGVMITVVDLEVLGEMRDPVRQESDLDLGRTRVRGVRLKFLNDLLLLSHKRCALCESGVPVRTAHLTAHVVSVADRNSILAAPSAT